MAGIGDAGSAMRIEPVFKEEDAELDTDVGGLSVPLPVLLQKGACAMRDPVAQCAIVVAMTLALAGCRTAGNNSTAWSWGKNTSNQIANGSANTPPLPSSGATPASNATAAPSHAGAVGGYPDQAGAATYGAPPAGAYGSQPAGAYGSQPTGAYGSPTPPAGSPPTGGYQSTQTQPNGAPAAGIGPQTGPYNENLSQAPAAAQSYPSTPYGSAPANAYQPPAGQTPVDAGQAQAYPSTNAGAYANSAPPAGAAQAPNNATGPYGSSPADPNGSYQTADNRAATDRYASSAAGPAQADQAAADRYATANAAPAAAPPTDGSYGSSPYVPGQTGYSPPGVPPYQVPGQPAVTAAPRRDPYYRPGGTSDYVSTGSPTSAVTADRYAPPTGAAPPDQYAPPGGYQSANQPTVR
jgi:hypothetical protein